MEKLKILVGLSGGVDSAVSAYLLKQAWHEIHCGFMVNYLDEENENCTTKIDLAEARKVADFLGLPFRAIFFYYKKKLCDFLQDKTFVHASFLQKIFPIICKQKNHFTRNFIFDKSKISIKKSLQKGIRE